MSTARASELPADIRLEYPFASNTLGLLNGATLHYVD